MNRHVKNLSALLLLVMMTFLPVVINNFHNHEDAADHQDCPVFQWESTFLATFVLIFALTVVASARRFVPPPLRLVFHRATVHTFHYRAPPVPHS